MALSKVSVQGIGSLISVVAIAISGFLVIQPLMQQTESNKAQLEIAKTTSLAKQMKLTKLEKGVDTFTEAKADTEDFLVKVAREKDIESASRALSEALVGGVNISSFNFGASENIAPLLAPTANLSGFTSPIVFEAQAAPVAGAPAATVESFHRVPIEVSVTASDYDRLAKYLDNLSQQTRLISVVYVDSTKPASTAVTAKIHAYAFVYSK